MRSQRAHGGRDTDIPSSDFKISTPQRLDFLLEIVLHLPVGLPLDVIVPLPGVLVSMQHRVLEVLKRLLMGLLEERRFLSGFPQPGHPVKLQQVCSVPLRHRPHVTTPG